MMSCRHLQVGKICPLIYIYIVFLTKKWYSTRFIFLNIYFYTEQKFIHLLYDLFKRRDDRLTCAYKAHAVVTPNV